MAGQTHPPDVLDGQHAIREAVPADAEQCGRIFYEAFESIATRHNLPIEPSSREFTRFKVGEMLASNGFAGLIAERAGEIVGSASVDERGAIGPVTVDPRAQDAGVGRALMLAALERERECGAVGIRLVQTAYHYRSLALYAKLGFAVREPLSVLQGAPLAESVPGIAVRTAQLADVDACNELCVRVHGHDRAEELRHAIDAGTAVVAQRPGGISAYATGIGYGWHAVAGHQR